MIFELSPITRSEFNRVMDRTTKNWLRVVRPISSAAVRLYCFPWAGGSSSAFTSWGGPLSSLAEVCAVQLPGRDDRLREKPFTKLLKAVEKLSPIIEGSLDRPFVLFGHSLGALLAFEVARFLRRRGAPRPLRLFASGSEAPDCVSRTRKRFELPEAEFIDEIRGMNGTSELVLADRELMSLFLPSLRADFEMAETYRFTPEEALDIPITALGGAADSEVREEALRSWNRHTSRSFRLRTVPGNHFFVQSNRTELLQALREDLTLP
jgi:medium-chain acyl-[acyl-carrier-protein] hydrolase